MRAFLITFIFIRPFICSLAFPEANIIFTVAYLAFLISYVAINRKEIVIEKKLAWPLAGFCAALGLSLAFSTNIYLSLPAAADYAAAILTWIIIFTRWPEDKIIILNTLLTTCVLIGLLAIYQYVFGFSRLQGYIATHKLRDPFINEYLMQNRAFWPFVTPNILGTYLAMGIPLFLIHRRTSWLLIIPLSALILTRSLGAIVSLYVGIIIFLYSRNTFKMKHLLYLSGLLLATLGIIHLRFGSSFEHLQPISSGFARLNYWMQSLGIIFAHVFTGVGPGNFNLAQSRFAHNAYLQLWAESGIFSLAAFIWLTTEVFKKRFRAQAGQQHININCLISSSAVFLISNFFDFSFSLPEASLIWWVIMAL